MAVRTAVRDLQARTLNMRGLWRLAIWGSSAGVALVLAVVAGCSDTGSRRLLAATPPSGTAAAQRAAAPATPQPAVRPSESDAETRRLAEAVGALAADRERLAARIGTLERNLEDMTGSIKQQIALAAAGAAASPVPAGTADPPATVAPAPAPSQEAAVAPATEASAPAPATTAPADAAGDTALESVATRTQFGIDVGGAVSFDGLRVLWSSTKGGNAGLFDGLHPVVAARENARTKSVELRLVAGPLANAEAAARICAALQGWRRYCQPVAFEGQRLAQADVVPERERKPVTRPSAAPKPAPKAKFPFR